MKAPIIRPTVAKVKDLLGGIDGRASRPMRPPAVLVIIATTPS